MNPKDQEDRTIEKIETETNEAEDSVEHENKEKQAKRTLFNDLKAFKDQPVTLVMYGNELIKGKLLGYDEVANCVLLGENNRRFIVLGRSISMICEGEVQEL